MNSRLWSGVVLSLTVMRAAAAAPVVRPDLEPPHTHKEPVIVADSAGGRLLAAWMNFPEGDPGNAEILISRSAISPDLIWSDPIALDSRTLDPGKPGTYRDGASGDPFLAADPTEGSHLIYITHVTGSLRQILLWTDDGENLTRSIVCTAPGSEDLDKPSVAASRNTLYVAHMVGYDTVHIHTRPRNIDTAQWTTTVLQFNLRIPDPTPSGREVQRNFLFSPIILVQELASAETITLLVEDYETHGYIDYAQARNITSKSNAILAWTMEANDLVPGATVYVKPKTEDPDHGYTAYRTGRLMQHPNHLLPNTQFAAASMLMAQGSTSSPTIGIVWHEREAFNEVSAAEVRFIAYDSMLREFGGTCPPEPIGEDPPCNAKPVASDSPVTPGNQFHPAIAVSPEGEFLITYYDSQSTQEPVQYTVKASTRIGNAVRTGVPVRDSASDAQGYNNAIGEYQGATYSAGRWFSAFIAVHNGEAEVNVEEIQLTSLPRCPNRTSLLFRCYNPTLSVYEGARLRLPITLKDGSNGPRNPNHYTFAYVDRSQAGFRVLSTEISYNRVVESKLAMTLFASQIDGDECDSLPVDLEDIRLPRCSDCVAIPSCKRRALTPHQEALLRPGEPYQLHAPVGEEYVDGADSWKWYRRPAGGVDFMFSEAQDPIDYPIVDTFYWVEEDNGIWAERFNTDVVHVEAVNSACATTVSPTSVPSVPESGGTIHFDVTMTPEGCTTWAPSSDSSWAVVDDTTTRGASGGFNVTVEANTGEERQAIITVADHLILITQQAKDCPRLPRRVSVDPRFASRTDRPVLVTMGDLGGTFHHDWYERLPEETTPRLYYKHTSSISVALSHPLTYYSAVVRNACGQTASLAEVPVYLCVPTIDTQPADQIVPRNGSVDLTVAASPAIAGQPVTYTWWSYDTGQIVGSGSTYRVTPEPGTTKTYYAHVGTDCSGTPFSMQTRAVTVTGCALAATASSDRNIALGQTATLTASVSGALPSSEVEYTWYSGPAPGTEYASGVGLWSITPAPQTTTQYRVRVKDGTCTADSNPVTVRICVPTITSQPQGMLIRAGQTASLSVGVAPLNNETLTYQWYVGPSGNVSNPVSGATSSTLTTPVLAATTSYWVRVTSSCGATKDSAAAVVTVCNNPVITSVTPTRYIRYGGSASHQVSATGSNLTYQWYTGSPGNTSAPIAGATQSSLSQSPSATTTYWARVTSHGLCTTDSPAMVIDVCTDPPITTHPASKTINSGQSATLSAATSATGATYQWFLGTGTAIQGATSSSLTVMPASDTQYFAQLNRGACTSTTNTATVTVCSLAASLSGGTNIALGQSATLTATESGSRSQPTNYEWYAGTGASSYIIASGPGLWQKTVTPSVTTQYWVRIGDGTCTADSLPVTVSVCKPTITAQPQGTTVNSGQTATLSVTATGAPLSYQWYIGAAGNTAQPISGATSATYTTPPMSATTSYWVRVTGCTPADSVAATVNVCAPPAITSGPTADSQRLPGTIGKMTVTATGTGLTYQWFTGQSGDTTVPVAGSSCSTAQCSFTLSASKYYWVRILGTCGMLNSPAVIHPVSPTLVQQPQSASVPPNATPTLSLTASGTDLTYQWYRGSTGNTATPMSGATAATFTVPPVTAPVSYWCRVTSVGNPTAITDSAEASLSFCTGPSIFGPIAQNLGYNSWLVGIDVDEADLGNVDCAWYTGVPGNLSQSVFQFEGGTYFYTTATGTQTWWCRAWYNDRSCYTDSGGATIYKVQ